MMERGKDFIEWENISVATNRKKEFSGIWLWDCNTWRDHLKSIYQAELEPTYRKKDFYVR